jgi:hypothetical protein
MLSCPCGHRVGDEVTDIFITAGPVLRTGLDRTEAYASALSRHAGEQAKSVSVIQLPPSRKRVGAVAHAVPLLGPLHGA